MNITPIVKLDRVIETKSGTAIRFTMVLFNEDWQRPWLVQDGWRLLQGWKVSPPASFGKTGLYMKNFNELDPEAADQIKTVLASYDTVVSTMGPWMPGYEPKPTVERILNEEPRKVE